MRSWPACAVALVVAATSTVAAQQSAAASGLEPLLARLSARVEQFYARARTVTSRESVRFQQLESDFRPVGFARRLVYELRLAWDPDGDGFSPIEAKALRQLVSVNGRPPRPKDEPECTDPDDVSTDALSMLLAQKRDLYEFTAVGPVRLENRAALAIEFILDHVEQQAMQALDQAQRLEIFSAKVVSHGRRALQGRRGRPAAGEVH